MTAVTRLAVLALTACSFSNTAGTSTPSDDAPPMDASTKDAPNTACNVTPSGTPVVAGIVGPGGGSDRADLVCAAGELPIGFSFRRANAIIATNVRCGALARDAQQVITTTPTNLVGDSGLHGGCFIPGINNVPEQTCPQGHVLVGITVNDIGSSYNSFSMTCQPLTAAMQIAGATTTIAFQGTGTDTSNLQTATCGPGMAIVSFGLKSGCDQEQLTVRCTSVTCE